MTRGSKYKKSCSVQVYQGSKDLSVNNKDNMECSVCYCDSGPFQTLTCSHSFCNGCIKQWYLKGTGTGCPMCRRPIYFKGFHKVRDQWNEDAYDTRCQEILSETMDRAIEQAMIMNEYFGEEMLESVMVDLEDIEKTWRFLRHEDICSDDIDYVLNETDEYYSDRHIDKIRYIDEPPKDSVVALWTGGGNRCGKRARANMDPWATISFYIEV